MKNRNRVIRWIGGVAVAAGLGVGVLQVQASSETKPISDIQQEQTGLENTNGPASYKAEEQVSRAVESVNTSEASQMEETESLETVQTEAAETLTEAQTEEVQTEEAESSAIQTQTPAQTESEQTSGAAEVTEREVAEKEIDDYFKDSVFVGDSVMLGFRNYAMRRQDTYLANMKFLAAGSLSVNNAFWPVSEKSVHPIYQGQKRLIWDSIALMQAKKVFLFFGLNDLNVNGVEGSCEKYKELVGKILESSPNAEIHILSMTYTLNGKGKGKLNNDNIRQFNDKMRQIAAENRWGFVDLASPLADETGGLAAQYCSDQFVHQTSAAYDVWSATLREYARNILKWTPQPLESVASESAEETVNTQTAQ